MEGVRNISPENHPQDSFYIIYDSKLFGGLYCHYIKAFSVNSSWKIET